MSQMEGSSTAERAEPECWGAPAPPPLAGMEPGEPCNVRAKGGKRRAPGPTPEEKPSHPPICLLLLPAVVPPLPPPLQSHYSGFAQQATSFANTPMLSSRGILQGHPPSLVTPHALPQRPSLKGKTEFTGAGALDRGCLCAAPGIRDDPWATPAPQEDTCSEQPHTGSRLPTAVNLRKAPPGEGAALPSPLAGENVNWLVLLKGSVL